MNRNETRLRSVDGGGCGFWMDEEAGFSVRDQEDLIALLLSLDDDPEARPTPWRQPR